MSGSARAVKWAWHQSGLSPLARLLLLLTCSRCSGSGYLEDLGNGEFARCCGVSESEIPGVLVELASLDLLERLDGGELLIPFDRPKWAAEV